MKTLCLRVFASVLAVNVVLCEFSIKEQWPRKNRIWRVKSGRPTQLSCASSHVFDVCQWGRPGPYACGIQQSSGMGKCYLILKNQKKHKSMLKTRLCVFFKGRFVMSMLTKVWGSPRGVLIFMEEGQTVQSRLRALEKPKRVNGIANLRQIATDLWVTLI